MLIDQSGYASYVRIESKVRRDDEMNVSRSCKGIDVGGRFVIEPGDWDGDCRTMCERIDPQVSLLSFGSRSFRKDKEIEQ